MNGRKFGIELEISNISMRQSYEAIKAIGIRVEIEGYNHTDHADHWKIVRDSSVENGHEVVSPILIGNDGLDEAVRVANALKAAGASANKTCGFHVHFDARNMNVNEIRTICTRYAKYEAEIDRFMPRSRRADNNRFCRSVVREFGYTEFKTATTVERLADAQEDRYFKVNLKAYLRHHTIEFRQHSGTVEAEKIQNWILFLNDFVNESIRIANGTAANAPAANAPKIQKHWQNLIDLLTESNGMLASDLISRLGIQPHSLRGQISHMRAAGIAITTKRTPAGSIYGYAGTAQAANEDALFNGVNAATRDFLNRRAQMLAA